MPYEFAGQDALLYLDLYEHAPVAYVCVGRDGRIHRANRRAVELFGYGVEDLVGRPVLELYADTPAGKEKASQVLRRFQAGEDIRDEELEIRTADGRHRLISLSVRPAVDEHGDVVGSRSIAVDVTERKRAEETLHALYQASLHIQEPLGLRDRLSRLLTTAREVLHLDRLNILLADPKGQWLEAVASLGTEEPPETLRVPIGPEGGGIAQAYLTQQTIGWDGHGPVPESYRLQPPYDQIAAFRSHAFANVPLIVHGRTIGVLGVDRKHSRQPLDAATLELLQLFAGQAALAIEQARLFAATERAAREARSLYEVAHTLTTSLDVTEVLHLVSVKTTELLGTPHAQVVLWDEATQTLRLGAAHGTEAQRAQAQEFRLGQGVNGIVAQTRAPLIVNDYQAFSQRVPWLIEVVAVIGVPLLYRDRLLGVLTSHATQPGSVITQEHLALLTSFADQAAAAIENAWLYENVRQHAAILEERVRERTRDLEAANQALAEASRHKSEFLATMSHEIRTPLNSIIGFAELVGEQRVGPLNEKQARYLGHIHNSGKHLLQLISDILDLSKVEAGKFVLQPEPLPVARTLEDILVIARGMANKKSQTLESQIEPDLPPLPADPVRFKQICFNLLSNAVKFTPDGGTIAVRARRVPGIAEQPQGTRLRYAELPATDRLPQSAIRNPQSEIGECLEIRVTDTGAGIRAEDLPTLFGEFVQLETTRDQHHEGSGLGLALTKKLVELHGGQIRAESDGVGRGSTFAVVLPFVTPEG